MGEYSSKNRRNIEEEASNYSCRGRVKGGFADDMTSKLGLEE